MPFRACGFRYVLIRVLIADAASTHTPVPVLPHTPVSSPGQVQSHRTPSHSARNKPLSAASGSVKAATGKGVSVKQSGTKPVSTAGSGSAKATSTKGGAANRSGKSSGVLSCYVYLLNRADIVV